MERYEAAVKGMRCAHCVKAVDEAVSSLDGVRVAHIDLATGLLRVDTEAPLELNDLAGAVASAGYELVLASFGKATSG